MIVNSIWNSIGRFSLSIKPNLSLYIHFFTFTATTANTSNETWTAILFSSKRYTRSTHFWLWVTIFIFCSHWFFFALERALIWRISFLQLILLFRYEMLIVHSFIIMGLPLDIIFLNTNYNAGISFLTKVKIMMVFTSINKKKRAMKY